MKTVEHSMTALLGALISLLAVILGAFGSHALGDLLLQNQRVDVYELANRYQLYHGLALLVIAALYQNLEGNRPIIKKVTAFITIGIVIFCGSLYLLALTNVSSFGALTPIGGLLLIIGWGILALQIWRSS